MTPANPNDGSADGKNPQIALVPLTAAFASVASALHAKGFDDAWDEDAIIRLLDVPGAFGILAYRPGDAAKNAEDQPLGFVLMQTVLDEAEINTITVDPDARRMGVGRALLDAVTDRLQECGVNRILLEVAVDNDGAIALYRQNGFSEVGRRKGYYARAGGRKVDALVLERLI
ncbi:ribosomal protein S18-alanine N-acetyltransferase [Thalassospira sp.]|uniref:ribosomal protein S18-alanine N-acetyltransferase n=1 Tax=Thalassospira sp. TaxID=1912094 RepID=UPI000C46A8F6|nr:ribosomal protein S18-alanine N-acetyltransferase [Thalassospira sp.]MBC04817.1 ribosomal-protein-alanine N-acetyltransferase [Thalassospira sp.]|tara:strand:- start:141 stop:659 length:519 start_codon:yes stop_codon:yes gene_type:complete